MILSITDDCCLHVLCFLFLLFSASTLLDLYALVNSLLRQQCKYIIIVMVTMMARTAGEQSTTTSSSSEIHVR